MGKQLRMPLERMTRSMQGFFVDWCSDNYGYFSSECGGHCAFYIGITAGPCGSIHHPISYKLRLLNRNVHERHSSAI